MAHADRLYAIDTLAVWARLHGIHEVRFVLARATLLADACEDVEALITALAALPADEPEEAPGEGGAEVGGEDPTADQGEGEPAAPDAAVVQAEHESAGAAGAAGEPPAPGETVTEIPVTEAETQGAESPEASTAEPEASAPSTRKRRRAHQEDGTFQGDDPSTPGVNEAFVTDEEATA